MESSTGFMCCAAPPLQQVGLYYRNNELFSIEVVYSDLPKQHWQLHINNNKSNNICNCINFYLLSVYHSHIGLTQWCRFGPIHDPRTIAALLWNCTKKHMTTKKSLSAQR